MAAKVIQPTDVIEVKQLCCLAFGQPGCLAHDTYVGYQIRNSEGLGQNHKGGSIDQLFRRFHNIHRRGAGNYQRPQTIGSEFFIQSVDDEGFIFLNKIADVIDSGVRQVYRLTTKSGKTLKATDCHRFMTEGCYKPLSKLCVGDEVLIHDRKMKFKGRQPRARRREVFVKNHGAARLKMVNGCTYCAIRESRAIIEAKRNNFDSLKSYIEALNTLSAEDAHELWHIPKGMDVHHRDENPLNNALENLQLVTKPEHNQIHIADSKKRVRFSVIADVIVAIEPGGVERVYDITVEGDHPNFIAAGFAVHNSRKSSLAQTAENPITFALDPGIYRAFGRKKSVLFDSWDDVVTFDTNGHQTIVVDTIGMCLGKLAQAVIADNPKNGNRLGGLSLPGYGELATRFAAWVHSIRSRGQDIVFLAQEKDERAGDETYYRPDIVGKSYNTLMDHCDMVGYLHFENGRRVIDFNPTDRWMAKTPPCGWGQIPLPDFGQKPCFLADILAEAKASMGRISEESADLAILVNEWKEWLDGKPDADALNAYLDAHKKGMPVAIKTQVWHLVTDYADGAGLVWDGKAKKFSPKQEEAA